MGGCRRGRGGYLGTVPDNLQAARPWQTVSTRVVYASPWLVLREDQVIRPTGATGPYPVVEMRPAVGVVALHDDGQLALVRQWRYVHRKMSLEIPTGGCEEGEEPLDAAVRELAEETGLAAEHWQPLGTIDNSNGSTTDTAHLYLATSLSWHAPVERDENERAELLWLPFDQAVGLAVRGEIVESTSVAALLKVHVLRSGSPVAAAGDDRLSS